MDGLQNRGVIAARLTGERNLALIAIAKSLSSRNVDLILVRCAVAARAGVELDTQNSLRENEAGSSS